MWIDEDVWRSVFARFMLLPFFIETCRETMRRQMHFDWHLLRLKEGAHGVDTFDVGFDLLPWIT